MKHHTPNTLHLIALILGLSTSSAWAVPPITTLSDVADNTAGGTAVLQNITISGYRNTGFGRSALLSNTDGYENTASGAYSLFTNTTGHNNTASGVYSLYSNTTGSFNTASGIESLYANTSGVNNTAIGRSSLSNNTTGSVNTGIGADSLYFNTTGKFNTASGVGSLQYNMIGNYNTADGVNSLDRNTIGNNNTASGYQSLNWNTTGNNNTASGYQSLFSNTTGINNTALGRQALTHNTTGIGNLALGMNAGFNLSSGNNNIYIGNIGFSEESKTIRIGATSQLGGTSQAHTRTFIGGIRGRMTGVANAVPVVIDANGQLGTVNSSARFKKDIQDMNEASYKLLQLRPVTYRYKQTDESGANPLEYGLIAEEVAKVYPDLVAYGADGKIETVQYQKLTPMLLNEVQHLSAQLAGEKQQGKMLGDIVKAEQIKNRQLADKVAALESQVVVLQEQAQKISVLTERLARLDLQQLASLNR